MRILDTKFVRGFVKMADDGFQQGWHAILFYPVITSGEYAHHVFSHGKHGLSLANEIWASGEYGEPYTMEQTDAVIEAIRNGSLSVPEDAKKELMKQFNFFKEEKPIEMKANREVEIWMKLAEQWLQEIWSKL